MPTPSLNCARAVDLALGKQVCLACKLLRSIRPKVVFHSARCYLRSPVCSVFADSKNPVRAVGLGATQVLHISRLRNISQITNPIVSWVPVNVVNVFSWPTSEFIEPSKPMASVSLPAYAYFQIPAIEAPCNISGMNVRCKSGLPSENASLWVVIKNFAQACCGKIGLSHDTVPSLIGQRPGRVISTSGLRHFITRACSGATGFTKCLQPVTNFVSAVCIPANNRRSLNPFGALTPFQRSKEKLP